VWLPNARFASAPDTPCSWLPDELLLSKAGWQDKFADVEGGISDHEFIDPICFRDPNGYVIELTAKRPEHDAHVAQATRSARTELDTWQSEKARA
jgi:catechol-2,3-dioxygenase